MDKKDNSDMFVIFFLRCSPYWFNNVIFYRSSYYGHGNTKYVYVLYCFIFLQGTGPRGNGNFFYFFIFFKYFIQHSFTLFLVR